MLPILRKMLGRGQAAATRRSATLTHALGVNGPREHYMRARLSTDGLHVFERQDSALLTVLAEANCLAIRPPHDSARLPGELLEIIPI